MRPPVYQTRQLVEIYEGYTKEPILSQRQKLLPSITKDKGSVIIIDHHAQKRQKAQTKRMLTGVYLAGTDQVVVRYLLRLYPSTMYREQYGFGCKQLGCASFQAHTRFRYRAYRLRGLIQMDRLDGYLMHPPCRISMLLFWRYLFIHVFLVEYFKKSVSLCFSVSL